ncbi:MAG: class I SAM-dependent methyltransferase [Proteobacteria bacterium]|nr:class I SAM-dependent methyltransferase [Pseudomonadota bacterium]
MVSEKDVREAFLGVLDREPESMDVIRHFQSLATVADVIRSLLQSEEFRARCVGHPLYHNTAVFDARALVERCVVQGIAPDPSFVTNAFGVKINPKFMPHILTPLKGQVERPPIPANWHADIAEFAAAFRAIELSQDRFAVAELGCGWGCWLNIAGVVARRRGLAVKLIGVEGDSGHIAFMRECCSDNGFSPQQVVAIHGIAAARSGVAMFPRQATPGVDWGLEPIFGATARQIRKHTASGKYDKLEMISLSDITSAHGPLDLLHIDIQGGEADLIENSQSVLSKQVAYLVVGTHSRLIEGRITEVMRDAGWRLEVERPAINMVVGDPPVIGDVGIDGVQGWRNPWLRP